MTKCIDGCERLDELQALFDSDTRVMQSQIASLERIVEHQSNELLSAAQDLTRGELRENALKDEISRLNKVVEYNE